MGKRIIKIAYLFPNFSFIGAQRAAAATIRKLDKKKYHVAVFVVDDRDPGMREELGADVPIYIIGANAWFLKMRGFRIFLWPYYLRKLIKINPIDVIISICPQTNFLLVLYQLFYKSKIKLIAEEHQHLSNAWHNDPGDFPRPWRYLYQFSLKNYHRLDSLRCVSNAARDDFVKVWHVPDQIVKTIYPAFDLHRIKAHALGIEKHKLTCPVICSVGRLTPQKDFALLIRSFRLVRDHMPCKLVIAGQGPEFERLNLLINTLDLTHDVTLLGFVDDAEKVIAAADLFVMTSIWEGFPATLIEAMTLGTAVITVNCDSGPAEIIKDGINGKLILSRSEREISDCIIEVISDPDARKAMVTKAKLDVEQFGVEKTAVAFERLISTLCSTN